MKQVKHAAEDKYLVTVLDIEGEKGFLCFERMGGTVVEPNDLKVNQPTRRSTSGPVKKTALPTQRSARNSTRVSRRLHNPLDLLPDSGHL